METLIASLTKRHLGFFDAVIRSWARDNLQALATLSAFTAFNDRTAITALTAFIYVVRLLHTVQSLIVFTTLTVLTASTASTVNFAFTHVLTRFHLLLLELLLYLLHLRI